MRESDFPSFDDFISTYTVDSMARWVDGANEIARSRLFDLPIDEANIHDFVFTLTTMNTNITLSILRDYHEWLRSQLEQKSVRLL